jgi:hypothetical protein
VAQLVANVLLEFLQGCIGHGGYLGGHVPSGQGCEPLARSATHRGHPHPHFCSTRPSGFQMPRTHVAPQSHSVGAGAGGVGPASRTMLARAAATAAAALGCSASIAAGSADNHTSIEISHL